MNIAPAVVIVFGGPSVKSISRNREDFSPEDEQSLEKIARQVTAISKEGMKFE